jgi:hypothetical protein
MAFGLGHGYNLTKFPPAGGGLPDGTELLTISASGNDGTWYAEFEIWALGIGPCWGDVLGFGGVDAAAARFESVPIPQGSVIVSATLEWTVTQAVSAAAIATLFGYDTNNAPALSISGNPYLWAPTSASVPGLVYTTTGDKTQNVTAIIQEIISRAGWVSGNALTLYVNPTTGVYGFLESCQTPNTDATITVIWTPP